MTHHLEPFLYFIINISEVQVFYKRLVGRWVCRRIFLINKLTRTQNLNVNSVLIVRNVYVQVKTVGESCRGGGGVKNAATGKYGGVNKQFHVRNI